MQIFDFIISVLKIAWREGKCTSKSHFISRQTKCAKGSVIKSKVTPRSLLIVSYFPIPI